MKAIIEYELSEVGRKVNILAGGDGQKRQSIEVGREHVLFAKIVEFGEVKADCVSLVLWDYSGKRYWDSTPTIEQLVQSEIDKRAAELAEESAEKEQKRQDTLAVLTDRKTVVRYHGYGDLAVEYHVADWPYKPDAEITKLPEAIAWELELFAESDAAKAKSEQLIADKKSREAAEKVAKEAAELARRESLGLREGDSDYAIESGAMKKVPAYCNHNRAKNWMARIEINPSSPGGLARDFLSKAKGEYYYMVPDLDPGNAVEFGADYYTGGGKKRSERWYGYVVRVDTNRLVMHECKDGRSAVKAGEKFAANLAKQDAATATASD